MKIEESVNLINYNTLKLSAISKYLVQLDSLVDIPSIPVDIWNLPKLIIGEGSNILLTSDWDGLVILMRTKGKKIVKETQDNVWLELESGENWHDLVRWTVDNNWGGIENLALIPGTVGAAPVQNIAAYGQNFVDVCEQVAFRHWDGTVEILNNVQCKFGYRDSIFKHEYKDKGIVTKVIIKLNKNPKLETGYFSVHVKNESLHSELKKTDKSEFGVKDVFEAVCAIRTRQLPDWKETPTAGSFFKNPVVIKAKLLELQAKVPELQYYPADQLSYKQINDSDFNKNEYFKIPAGRLLDDLGWRGKFVGHCGSFKKHAMILTHDGQATGIEMYDYVKLLQKDVKEKFGVELEMEVVKI